MFTSDFVIFWPSAVSQEGNRSFISPHQIMKPKKQIKVNYCGDLDVLKHLDVKN